MFHISQQSQRRVRLACLFDLLRLLCLVVGKVAVVSIVLSVSVDVPGGESVRVVVVHVASRVEAAAVVAVLTVIVVVPCCCY